MKNMKHCIWKSEKKCKKVKEKWINDKFKSIDLHNRSTEQTMYRSIEEISGKKTCSSTICPLLYDKNKIS